MARVFGAAILLVCGRAFSQRGRNGGFEIRQPKHGPTLIKEEERHKFIHDGREYHRAPNLFDVGNGELRLLPEVLSELNFESREFRDDGTLDEQNELRDSRFWGRLYVDGWPAPMQYLRSHFGGPAVEGMRALILADPLDACTPLRNAGGATVIASRGRCTYTSKARLAQEANATGLLIVNNEPGIEHPPGPDGMDLEIFSAMIPRAEGTALMEVLKSDAAQGMLVPINCQRGGGVGDLNNQRCHPAKKTDRQLVADLPLGGFLRIPSGETFEYLLAEFGVKVPPQELSLASPRPRGLCTPSETGDLSESKAVLASRGVCGFIDKAESASVTPYRIGALIVVNNETSLFHMGASPRWRGANISFPTLLVSTLAGAALSTLPADASISLTPSTKASAAAWENIGKVRNASAWPKEKGERQSMYQTLLTSNAGFADRLSAIRQAFDAVAGDNAKPDEDYDVATAA